LERVGGITAEPAHGAFGNTVGGRTVNDPDPQDTAQFVFPSSLHNGDNLIAVKLIQANITSSDLTMFLNVVAETQAPLATGQPKLTLAYDGTKLTISWSPSGGTLQYKNNLNDASWTTQTGATSPFTVNNVKTAGPHRFYRVVQ
jgi:hypothetical protein